MNVIGINCKHDKKVIYAAILRVGTCQSDPSGSVGTVQGFRDTRRYDSDEEVSAEMGGSPSEVSTSGSPLVSVLRSFTHKDGSLLWLPLSVDIC